MPVPLLGGSLRIPAIGYGVGTAWYKSKGEKSAQLVASLQAALDHGVPVVQLLSGGYTSASTPVIASCIKNLFDRFNLGGGTAL